MNQDPRIGHIVEGNKILQEDESKLGSINNNTITSRIGKMMMTIMIVRMIVIIFWLILRITCKIYILGSEYLLPSTRIK